MLGKWSKWYKDISVNNPKLHKYGDTSTYQIAADFLSDMEKIEDWGCGPGRFRKFYNGKYIGVDGTKNIFVDKVKDLRKYKSNTDGIIMRHVLEHNYDWEKILKNAVKSFKKKFCLILFTPFAVTTHQIDFNEKIGVPDIAFKKEDIEKCLDKCEWEVETIPTNTIYGIEHVYKIWKRSK